MRSPRRAIAGRPRLRIDPRRYAGYFEAHIEQGSTLESGNLKIGVVTAIVGLWDYRITVDRPAESRRHHDDVGTPRCRADAWCG